MADTIASKGGALDYLTPAMKNCSSFGICVFVRIVFHLTSSKSSEVAYKMLGFVQANGWPIVCTWQAASGVQLILGLISREDYVTQSTVAIVVTKNIVLTPSDDARE
jgi:hypothetical protein